VRSRRYDERFWQELLGKKPEVRRKETEILGDLGF